MTAAEQAITYLRRQGLKLATAESCTAGMVISLLAAVEGSGSLMDCGYVVYSPEAKKRLLGVRQSTIDTFNLTSEEVAREMALGALQDSTANVAIANTGVAGPDAMDGIPPGTVCLAWAFHYAKRNFVFSRTLHLDGDRRQVRRAAAEYAIRHIEHFHRAALQNAWAGHGINGAGDDPGGVRK
jgi:nicotinamide-nucleotide amidase